MSQKKQRFNLTVWLRRLCQAFFLIFFFYLFIQTTFQPNNEFTQPIKFFFQLDPLIMAATWLATYAIPAALFISLITLIVTLLFGRWFCGWVCPFGVIHNMFTSLRKRKLKDRLATASYTTTQRLKYYILLACLIGALIGWNAVGWLDPFSFLYRSMATAVFPVFNWVTVEVFTWLYDTFSTPIGEDPSWVTAVSEPIYEVLRNNVLANQQPFYAGSLLIGLIFVTIVALNLFRARFWCRYICPLGAMLGVVGKNPLYRLKKDEELCNGCRICVTNCQGGAEPQTINGWRPSECFYCWNCVPACPTNAISFGFGEAHLNGVSTPPSDESTEQPDVFVSMPETISEPKEEAAPAKTDTQDTTSTKPEILSPKTSSESQKAQAKGSGEKESQQRKRRWKERKGSKRKR